MISKERIEKLIKEKIPKDSRYNLNKVEVTQEDGYTVVRGSCTDSTEYWFAFKVDSEGIDSSDYEALCAQRVVYQMEKVFHPEKELDFIMKMLENEKSNS